MIRAVDWDLRPSNFIKASGLKAPRNQAGHMTASRLSERQKKHLPIGAVL
jgi:hypothetical protein